jgi:hypothetical protein
MWRVSQLDGMRLSVARVLEIDASTVAMSVRSSSISLTIAVTSYSSKQADLAAENLRLVFLTPQLASTVFDGVAEAPIPVLAVSAVRDVDMLLAEPPSPTAPPPPPSTPPSPPPAAPASSTSSAAWSTSNTLATVCGAVALLLLMLCLFARTRSSHNGTVAPFDADVRCVKGTSTRLGVATEVLAIRERVAAPTAESRYKGDLPSHRPLRVQHLQANNDDLLISRAQLGRYLRGDWRTTYYSGE